MRKVTKEYEVYDYDELDEKAKNKVRNTISEWLMEINSDAFITNLNYNFKDKYGFEPDDTDYSLGNYSSSDFFSFKFKNVFTDSSQDSIFWKNIKKKLSNDELDKLDNFIKEGFDFNIDYSGRYSQTIDASDDFYYYDENYDLLGEELVNLIEKVLLDTTYDIDDFLVQYYYDFIEISEDDIKEDIEINELQFTKNGDIFD